MKRQLRSERGQAAVEFVAVLPFIVVAGLVAWQLVLVGHVAWMTAGAARSAARAVVVGHDGRAAARSALPPGLRDAARVTSTLGGPVRVSVPIPFVVYGVRTTL